MSAKKDNIGVYVRLPRDVVEKLDELAVTTRGSRSAVVKLLVSSADIRTEYGPIKRIVFPSGKAKED